MSSQVKRRIVAREDAGAVVVERRAVRQPPDIERDLGVVPLQVIVSAARDFVEGTKTQWLPEENPGSNQVDFKGPF